MHTSLIHKNQKPDTMQISNTWLIHKQNIVYSDYRILFTNKKEWSIDTCYSWDVPENMMQNAKAHRGFVRFCLIHRESRLMISRGWRNEEKGSDCYWAQFLFEV